MFDFKKLFKEEVKEILDESKNLEKALMLNKEKTEKLLKNNKTDILKKELKRLIACKVQPLFYNHHPFNKSNQDYFLKIDSELNELIDHLWD